jgi:hypothetical protein
MPLAAFDALPDDARLWIFGASAPIDDVDEQKLLAAVDGFLLQWKAHGNPLTASRDWRDEHFLAIAVDQRTEGASGCSIDGLFRTLQGLETALGASLVGGGLVYFRDPLGFVHAIPRDDFETLARTGDVNGDTKVFDTTLTTLGDYRTKFERRAADSWHAALIG